MNEERIYPPVFLLDFRLIRIYYKLINSKSPVNAENAGFECTTKSAPPG